MKNSQKSPSISIPHWRLKWGWRKRNIVSLPSNRYDAQKDTNESFSPHIEPTIF